MIIHKQDTIIIFAWTVKKKSQNKSVINQSIKIELNIRQMVTQLVLEVIVCTFSIECTMFVVEEIL